MLADQFATAIAGANNYASIETVSRLLWAAHAAGQIPDNAAQGLAEALQARKAVLRGPRPAPTQKRASARRRPCRSPDKARSIARRRAVATSGAVPSKIAAAFTLGELAVLSIIAGEVRRNGDCRLCVDAIAAQAGVCRRIAQTAIREAQRLGLVVICERRRPGQKNLPNVVEIIAREWLFWLKIGNDRMQKSASHEYHLFIPEKNLGFLRARPLHYPALGDRISHQEVTDAKRASATGNNRRIYRD
jgi:hypothetical protein